MVQAKKVIYEIGKLIKVATAVCMAAPEELQARFGIGNRVFQTKSDIEASGQSIPCGAQALTADQQKANPGKLLMVTEGFTRLAIAVELGRDLEVLVHAPYTDVQIFERNVSANGPKSDLSVMDIHAILVRGLKLGLAEADLRKKLAFVAGRGKSELGKMRYTQYLALGSLPAEIQLMGHNGEIQLNAILHMTNAKRTTEQFEQVVATAMDRRKREAKEQYDRDVIYIKREKDAALAAAMKGELGPEPVYIAKTQAKRVSGEVSVNEPLTTADIKQSEADLGMGGKNAAKLVGQVDSTGTPLTIEELIHVAAQLRARDGVMIEVGNAFEGLILRKISEAEFCTLLEAIIMNGGGISHRIRRDAAEKMGTRTAPEPTLSKGRRKADEIPVVAVHA